MRSTAVQLTGGRFFLSLRLHATSPRGPAGHGSRTKPELAVIEIFGLFRTSPENLEGGQISRQGAKSKVANANLSRKSAHSQSRADPAFGSAARNVRTRASPVRCGSWPLPDAMRSRQSVTVSPGGRRSGQNGKDAAVDLKVGARGWPSIFQASKPQTQKRGLRYSRLLS